MHRIPRLTARDVRLNRCASLLLDPYRTLCNNRPIPSRGLRPVAPLAHLGSRCPATARESSRPYRGEYNVNNKMNILRRENFSGKWDVRSRVRAKRCARAGQRRMQFERWHQGMAVICVEVWAGWCTGTPCLCASSQVRPLLAIGPGMLWLKRRARWALSPTSGGVCLGPLMSRPVLSGLDNDELRRLDVCAGGCAWPHGGI